MTEEERFDRCLGAVLRLEGGYADEAGDPGGPTKLGVTRAVLSEALGRPAAREELRALTPQAVRPIYRERYWRPVGCGQLRAGLDLLVFDTAVNMGPTAAARMLQAAAEVRADGVVGPRTLAAANEAAPAVLIEGFCRARERRYRAMAHFPTFGAGWLNRLHAVKALASQWAEAAS
jgi:lysozyme family protein